MNNYIKVLRDIKKGSMPLVKEWDLQDVIDLNMFVYKLNHGYSFDIHNPKTFSEKIQFIIVTISRRLLIRFSLRIISPKG